jgi:hypothetical protein
MDFKSEDDLDTRLTRATELIERGELRREHALVDGGTRMLGRVADELSLDHPQRAHVLSLLGAGRLRLFDLTGNAEVLDEAISNFSEAVALTATSAPRLVDRTYNLADAHVTRYDLTGALPDLDMAISLLRDLNLRDPAKQVEFLIALGGALIRRCEREGTIEILNEAITCLREGIRLGPEAHLSVVAVGRLAAATAHQARLQHDVAPINEAVALLRERLDQSDHLAGPTYECSMGSLLLERHRLFDDADALTEGTAYLRRGLAGMDKTSPDRPAFMARLAAVLSAPDDDPDEAVSLLREAIGTALPHDRYRGHYRVSLIKLLLDRFSRSRDVEALDEAVHLLESEIADGPTELATSSWPRRQLADALLDRYRVSAQENDLSRAIVLYQELSNSVNLTDPLLAFYLSRLGDALILRYTELDDVPALYEAVAVYKKTVGVARGDDSNICSYQERLGKALLHAGQRGGQEAILVSAVDALRAATTTADSARRATILGELGVALVELSKHGSTESKIARLAESADRFREAARIMDASSRSHRVFLADLAEVLYLLSEASGRIVHLDEAISIRRELARMFVGDVDSRDQDANRTRLLYLQKHLAENPARVPEKIDKNSSPSAEEASANHTSVDAGGVVTESDFNAFVSYSSRDRAFARRLAGDLSRRYTKVWLDELELRPGVNLDSIVAAITHSQCLIVLVSPPSMSSPWVTRELEIADQAGVQILPAVLDDDSSEWPAQLSEAAPIDFRRPEEYRRSFQRLFDGILGEETRAAYLTAKQAIAVIKATRNPTGELFGVSQQGVALLYSLINSRDWELADAMAGTSRVWIAEFYDELSHEIQTYGVVDGQVHDISTMYPLHSVEIAPGETFLLLVSCGFNHLLDDHVTKRQLVQRPVQVRLNTGVGTLLTVNNGKVEHVKANEEPATRPAQDDSGSKPFDLSDYTSKTRSFTAFQPLRILQSYIDSDQAVSSAMTSARQQGVISDGSDDVLVLTRLERDKRNGGLLTWSVAFFDPTLAESLLAVGVNAIDGTVRNHSIQAEILNASFTWADRTSTGATFRAPQERAIGSREWDIPIQPMAPTGLRLTEAFEMVMNYVDADSWQIGNVSNTGVTVFALANSVANGRQAMLDHTGHAGQWVIEIYSAQFERLGVRPDEKYGYRWRQIVCTRADGAMEINETKGFALDFPLSDSPLPLYISDAFERARKFAIRTVRQDFLGVSAVLDRRIGGSDWYFRFYDVDDIIARRLISGDGNRLISETAPASYRSQT